MPNKGWHWRTVRHVPTASVHSSKRRSGGKKTAHMHELNDYEIKDHIDQINFLILHKPKVNGGWISFHWTLEDLALIF
jgi:hypothetical protein